MPAPATAESLLHLLDRSGLLPAETVDQYRTLTGSPRQITDALLRDRVITPFQSRQLLAGRSRGFFLTDKYKVLDLLGEGGMGRVLLCEHLMLNKLQAVKVLTGADDVPGAEERFIREARALATLDDPYIARVFDVDRSPTGLFLVMEFVDGTNLHLLVAQHGPADPRRAAGFCRMAALGLQHAHEMGLIHRDVKPGNLMLDRAGTVKLLDLGLAKFFDAKRNQNLTKRFDAKNVLGTADFIAPEQAMNSSGVDIRADIYSLGCTLYYLLTARFPFPDGQPMEKLLWHQAREFDPVRRFNPAVPAGLADVLDRMVRKNPADRYQTPEAAAAALGEWASPPAPPPAAEMPRQSPAHYLLGLSPPPSTTSLSASPTSPVRIPRYGDDSARTPSADDLVLPPSRATDPGRTPRTTPTLEQAALSTATRTDRIPPSSSRRVWLAAGLAGVLLAAIGLWAVRGRAKPPAPAGASPLVVSGSTFVRPLMEHWADLYERQTGVRVEYEAVGSPRGVARMTEQVAAVGLTDVPLTPEQVRAAEKVGGLVVQVPLALGAVAVTYTLPDAGPEPVRLSGPLLAAMYRGRITRWNDPGLVALNPGRMLPPTPVVAVRRQDGSGTTALFTRFLKWEVADWPDAAVGTDPTWPGGTVDAKGNDGVAAEVGRTTGAVGYVDLTLAMTRRLTVAAVVNSDGKAVRPTVAGVQAAARDADIRPDPRFSLVGRPGPDSYPVVGTTWAVAYEKPAGGRGPAVAAFLRWCVGEGQQHVADLHYAPLPESLAGPAAAAVGSIR